MTERATRDLIDRAVSAHRAMLRESRLASVAEEELAGVAWLRYLPLTQATRSSHPTAKRLRKHLRAAHRMQRFRNGVLHRLVSTRTTSSKAVRAKLFFANALLDGEGLPSLLVASAAKDVRALTD